MVDNSELADIKQMLNDAVDFLGSSPRLHSLRFRAGCHMVGTEQATA
jgi:hypothetical protein